MELLKFIHVFASQELIKAPPNMTGTKTPDVFKNALQNFAEQICKKQRENCKKQAELDGIDWSFAKGILNAEQPKIDDLLTKK